MIIVMKANLPEDSPQLRQVMALAESYPGVRTEVRRIQGATRSVTEVYLLGPTGVVPQAPFEEFESVEKVVRVTQSFRAIGRHDGGLEAVGFEYNGVHLSQDTLHVFPGLCAVDTPENLEKMFRLLQQLGIVTTRAGAYKPRSSPYDFQGLGAACLPWVFELAGKYGIRIVAMEVTHESHIDEIQRALEASGSATGVMLQIGTRNAQNFELLKVGGPGDRAAGAVQARHGHHARGVAERVRVRRERRQSAHRVLPAGHEDQPGRSASQLRRFRPRAGGQAAHAPAGVHRPLALGGTPRRRAGRHARHLPRHRAGRDRRRQHGAGRRPPEPSKALCDGPQALLLDELPRFLEDVAIARRAYEERRRLAARS